MFFRLWLLNAGIVASNATRQLLLIAVSQIILYCVKRSKDARKQESDRGISLCSFKRGRRHLFHYSIVGNFMVYQDRIETNLLQLFAQQENSEWFQSFPLAFLRLILLLNRNKNIGKHLLVFYKFPFPRTFILLPLPYRCFSGPEKKHCCHKAQILKPMFPLSYENAQHHQNRRQKVFNRSALRLCREAWHLQFNKVNWFVVFNASSWQAWRFVWGGSSPPKPPPWRWDWVPPDHLGSEISFLYKQHSEKYSYRPKNCTWLKVAAVCSY